MAARRHAVAMASAQVSERNRQQIALLESQVEEAAQPGLKVMRGGSTVLRTRLNTRSQFGHRAAAGA
jgi:hypothetical protein